MSIMLTYSVFCDHLNREPGRPSRLCPRWVAETTDGIEEARLIAKQAGWVHRKGQDLCPMHKDCTHG